MLIMKNNSDDHREKLDVYTKRYEGNDERIRRAMSRERFVLNEESTFDYLYSERTNPEIGVIINKALGSIEDNNATKLRGVLRNIDFNSDAVLGSPREITTMLCNDFVDLH